VLAKIGLRYCAPLDLATLRYRTGRDRAAAGAAVVAQAAQTEHPWPAVAVGVIQTGGFLALSSVATAGGWMMRLYVLHRLPAGTTSMSSLGVPVIALARSAIQLGERPHPAELAGMALIATALAIVSWDTVRQHREVDPQMGQE